VQEAEHQRRVVRAEQPPAGLLSRSHPISSTLGTTGMVGPVSDILPADNDAGPPFSPGAAGRRHGPMIAAGHRGHLERGQDESAAAWPARSSPACRGRGWAGGENTEARSVPAIAVVAHTRKRLDGGLSELREVLAQEGVTDPLWYEVKKSRKAPKYARQARAEGAEVIFVWGGDGTVQRCLDAVAGTGAVLAILPAGTANLLAQNLQIPAAITEAVRIGLKGERRRLDTGSVNGEHFAVMAGAGFDARMIKEAGRRMKGRFGRVAYLYAGARNLTAPRARAVIEVDGRRFFRGPVSCVLAGNVPKALGGIEVFAGAQPDDGLLELGLVTASGPAGWARALARVAAGRAADSPLIQVTRGKTFHIRFDRPVPCELDGGGRPAVTKLKIKVHPGSVTICVPPPAAPR
jgi:diacylglycerol kinase (ATP)